MKIQKSLPILITLFLSSASTAFAQTPTQLITSPSILGLSTLENSVTSAHQRLPIVVQKLEKKDFGADDDIVLKVTNPNDESVKAKITDANGKEVTLPIEETTENNVTELTIQPDAQFKPGKYTLSVTDQDGKTTKQDFTWGVLALNPDKAMYKPQEKASIAIAVLDDKGDMVCDANVTLDIQDPKGGTKQLSTDNKDITINPECTSHNITLKPDNETSYQLAGLGQYNLTLTAKTKNGARTITDIITVSDTMPFEIKRTSATRIYPPLDYPMNLEITAANDFTGTIVETVPESFSITPADTNSYDNMQTLYGTDAKNPEIQLESSVLSASTSALVMPFEGNYQISQGFGHEMTDLDLKAFYSQYSLSGHDGIDFALPMGTPLYAVDDGNILLAGDGDYGITVVIQHSWGRSYYGHLSKTTVEKGYSAKKGSLIGYSGNTGESTGPHLHFGMKPENPDQNNGYAGKVNPLAYLPIRDPNYIAQAPTSNVLGLQTTASDSAQKEFAILENQIKKKVVNGSTTEEKVKAITWNVSMKKGETVKLSYKYKAPQVSPQFYTVGPLQFLQDEASGSAKPIVYEEARSWQIAADAIGTFWYNNAWQYRKQITVLDAQVPGNLTNFPVEVSISNDRLLAAGAQADGDDILFTSTNGTTKLDHEIERYSNGTLVAWVEVPTLNGSADTILYLYYGNQGVTNQENITGVWDANYLGVWHMNENGSHQDSTSNGNNSTSQTLAAPGAATGQIDGASDFNGTTEFVDVNDDSTLDTTAAFTLSVWANPDTVGSAYACPVVKNNYYYCIHNTGDIDAGFVDTANAFNNVITAGGVTADVMQYFEVTFDNPTNTITAYRNGSNLGSIGTAAGTPDIAGTTVFPSAGMSFGRDPNADEDFDGIIDEIRISNIVRTANWRAAEYNNQNSPSTFYTLGVQETRAYVPDSQALIMRHGKFFDNPSGTFTEQPFVY